MFDTKLESCIQCSYHWIKYDKPNNQFMRSFVFFRLYLCVQENVRLGRNEQTQIIESRNEIVQEGKTHR